MEERQKVKRSKRELTEGSIAKNVWYLTLPMMVGILLQNTFNIVDMIFVGRLGPAAIAAVSMNGILLGVIWTLIMGISLGTVAMVARFIGARRFEEADNVAMQSLFMGILGSIPITLIGFFLAGPILQLLGARGEVLSLGISYLRIISLGSITMFLPFITGSTLRGAGDVYTPMKILGFATILNIILDPLFIFGFWGFPRWGVAGSALATVLSQGVGALILLYILFRGLSVLHVSLKKARLNLQMMWRISKIGVFGSLQMVIWNVSDLVLMRIVAIYGTFAVAAYGIGMRVIFVVMMPGFSLAQSAATLVGQNLGAKKPARAERSVWIAAGLYEIIMVGSTAILIIFARNIVSIFNLTPEIVRIGSNYIRFISLTFFFMALSIVLSRAMNGAGDTVSPMVITGISLFILRIPLVLFLAKSWATTGIWAGIAISNVVQGLITAFWFTRGRWKHKAM